MILKHQLYCFIQQFALTSLEGSLMKRKNMFLSLCVSSIFYAFTIEIMLFFLVEVQEQFLK